MRVLTVTSAAMRRMLRSREAGRWVFMKTHTLAFCFVALCSVGLGLPLSSVSAQEARVELPSAVREELSKLPKRDAVRMQLRSLKIDIDTGSETAKAERIFYPLENGLTGIMEVLPSRNSQAQSLSLHGLIDLVWMMEMVTSSESVVPIPIGKVFVPFGINRSTKTSVLRKTSSLSGDLKSLNSPSPEMRFSYQQNIDAELTSKGLLSLSTNFRSETTVTCNVQGAVDAKTLHPKFQGAYLPVSCEGKDPKGPLIVREFAYLVDSQVYLLLSLSGGDQKEKYKITDVEYSPQ